MDEQLSIQIHYNGNYHWQCSAYDFKNRQVFFLRLCPRKVNWTEPQEESRGHNIGSKWVKSSLKYSLHVIPGTEPKFHNNHH